VGIVVRRCACILLLEYPPSPTYLPTYRPTTLAGLLPFVPRRAVRRAALRRGHEGRCTLHFTTTLRLHLPIYYLPVLRSIADMKVGALCTLLHKQPSPTYLLYLLSTYYYITRPPLYCGHEGGKRFTTTSLLEFASAYLDLPVLTYTCPSPLRCGHEAQRPAHGGTHSATITLITLCYFKINYSRVSSAYYSLVLLLRHKA
jgi:hypothetical protein